MGDGKLGFAFWWLVGAKVTASRESDCIYVFERCSCNELLKTDCLFVSGRHGGCDVFARVTDTFTVGPPASSGSNLRDFSCLVDCLVAFTCVSTLRRPNTLVLIALEQRCLSLEVGFVEAAKPIGGPALIYLRVQETICV